MVEKREKELIGALITTTRLVIILSLIVVSCIIILIFSLSGNFASSQYPEKTSLTTANNHSTAEASPGAFRREIPIDVWQPPGENSMPSGNRGNIIRYGKELIVNTSKYLGPQGSVAHITNGMNCQNCHLGGGTKLFGNNFAGFIASYPKFSGRNNKVESASERIAECFERSLNGKSPDTAGKEVQAILAYIKWLGKNVKKGQKLFGNATEKLTFMNQPADFKKGKQIFALKCQSCHGRIAKENFQRTKNRISIHHYGVTKATTMARVCTASLILPVS